MSTKEYTCIHTEWVIELINECKGKVEGYQEMGGMMVPVFRKLPMYCPWCGEGLDFGPGTDGGGL
jgi:hypothetical protein